MYENLCQPCIIQPTRIVDKQKPSLIDNIFINSIESPVSGNLDKISDHFPNFIIINKYSDYKVQGFKRPETTNAVYVSLIIFQFKGINQPINIMFPKQENNIVI